MPTFKRSKIKNVALDYIEDFGKETTLHGIRYILNSKFHILERLLWLFIITLAIFGAGSLIINNWTRYNANPTVISLEKNFRDWSVQFPSVTVCFQDKMNETLAAEYIAERWGVEDNTTEYNLYYDFLYNVANLQYGTMGNFSKYLKSPELMSISGKEMIEITKKIMLPMQYRATIFNTAYNNLTFYETLTELGICYSYSGYVTNFISLVKNHIPARNQLPTCNYLNSLCYARVEDLPTIIRYYVHDDDDIPDSSDKFFEVGFYMELDTTFRFQETVASKDLRRLEPKQRQCRFTDEPLGKDPVYCYSLCQMNCRKKMALSLCGCLPYFYVEEKGVPICDSIGLSCLSKHATTLIRLREKGSRGSNCVCFLQCEATVFYLDTSSMRRWKYPIPNNIGFRWAVERYSKTRYKRDIIFGFEDLLVSLGGTAALFLGCSLLSFVELIYYFTLRLFWFLISTKKKNKK